MALRSHRARTSRRGSALIPALFVVLLLAALSLTYVRLSIDRHRETRSYADAKRAFYVAEAGLAEAFFGLATGRSGNVASDQLPAGFGGGVFWVVAEDAGPGRLTLKSTGLAGSGRAALSLVVEQSEESVASLGMFGGAELRVEPGARVDSYDSREGTYEAQLELGTVDGARIGSNGDVTVSSTRAAPTAIQGDASPGPEHTVYRDASATITGSTAPREEAYELPAIEVPPLEVSGSLVQAAARAAHVIAGGEHGWTLLHVERGGAVVLQGPATVVVDVLRVDAEGSLSLDATNGPVHLHVRDQLDVAAGSKLTSAAGAPADVALLVSASSTVDRDGDGVPEAPARLEASGTFHGTIYAPGAALTLPPGIEVFGAAAAGSLTIAAGARLHFDRALVDVGGEQESLPHVSCWRIVDLPYVPLVQQKLDPLTVLKLGGIDPVAPAGAHYEVGVPPPSNDPKVSPSAEGLPKAGLGERATESVEEEEPETVLDAPNQALMDLCAGGVATATEVKDQILANSPVAPEVLLKAIERSPSLSSTDLRQVLLAQTELSKRVLNALLDRPLRASSSDLKQVLLASSPLPADVLMRVTTAVPPYLTVGDLTTVILAQ